MKHRQKFLALATLLAAALTTHAQTWQTVDDFQPPSGLRAYGSDIGTDPSGNLYAVGGASLNANDVNRLAVVNVSYDHGTNWMTLPQPQEPVSNWEHNRAFASTLETTADGSQQTRLFVGGNGGIGDYPGGMVSWYIRESVDEGQTWTTTDTLAGDYSGCADIAIHPITGDVYASGSSSALGQFIRRRSKGDSAFTTVYSTGSSDIGSGWAIGFHPTTGSVIVVGDDVDPSTRQGRWSVLKSDTGDLNSWTTKDTFSTAEWTGICAGGVLVTSDTIYVSGWAYNSKTRKNHWVVRASADGGNTWTLSDNFTYGGFAVQVFEMTQDENGNIYVCGQASDKFGKVWWIVRKWGLVTTVVKGKPVTKWAWSTSDAFQLASGKAALAIGITVDASGSVFTCGRAQDATGIEHWIVRKLAH